MDGVPGRGQQREDDRGVHEVERVARRTLRDCDGQTGEARERCGHELDEDRPVDPGPPGLPDHCARERGDEDGEGRCHRQPCHQRMKTGHQGHVSPRTATAIGTSNRRRAIAGWLAAATLLGGLIVVAAPQFLPVPAIAQTATVQNDAATLYLQNCASCHGPQGQGTNAGPTLVGAGAAAADFYLRTGRMPLGAPGQQPIRQTPKCVEAQIQALVAYVASFGAGPGIPQVIAGGDVHRGFALYNANCAACHAATGAGNAVGGGFFAVGLGKASDQQIAEAMLVGPGVMPRFSMTDTDRDALIAYIAYLRTAPTPGGAPIGGIGPVAEGFVAVVIGLSLLVLIAVFVGRRRPDDREASESPVATNTSGAEGGT
jgi:ubiquinol-cytochrome c reductase cytochrome c subunit